MKCNIMKSKKPEIGLSIFWLQISIGKSDGSNVFHCSNSKLRTKYLIIFGPWEFNPGVRLIKFDSYLHDSKQLRSIDIVFLAVSQENTHWNLALFIFVFNHIKLTGAHVVNIC